MTATTCTHLQPPCTHLALAPAKRYRIPAHPQGGPAAFATKLRAVLVVWMDTAQYAHAREEGLQICRGLHGQIRTFIRWSAQPHIRQPAASLTYPRTTLAWGGGAANVCGDMRKDRMDSILFANRNIQANLE